MKTRPTLFIGSSTEGLHIAEALQVLLDRDVEVTLWSQGVFELNKGFLESLNDSLDNFDFAILVLTADDLTRSRQTESPSPRDNVLFELGLFMGRLGRNRCFFVYDETQIIKLPTDLMGVSTATYTPHESGNLESALGATCTRIKRVITSLGPRQKPLNASRPNSEVSPPQTDGRPPDDGGQNNLDSTEQSTVRDSRTESSVKAPWYRFLLSQWKLAVVSALSGIVLGLLLARLLTPLGWLSGGGTANINPPHPISSVTPYSPGEKDQNVVYLLGSGTVYRYLKSIRLFDERKHVQVLEGPTEVGAGLFKSGYSPVVLTMAAEKLLLKDLRQYPEQQAYIYEVYLRADPLRVLFAAGAERRERPADSDNFFMERTKLTFDELREKWTQEKYDIYTGAEGSGTRKKWERYLPGDGNNNAAYPSTPLTWDIRFSQITEWKSRTLPRLHLGSEILNEDQEEVIRSSGLNIRHHSITMVDKDGDVQRGLYLYGRIDTNSAYKDRDGNVKGFYLPRPIVELLNYILDRSVDKKFLHKDCLDMQRKYFHLKQYKGEAEVEGWVSPSPPSGEELYRPETCKGRIE